MGVGGSVVRLFDGVTLDGWHAVPRVYRSMPADEYTQAAATSGRWEVEDGAIVGGQEIRGYGGYLLTDDTYADFELHVEARPDWPADTGVLVRATALGSEGFQVLLDHRPSGGIGGFYGNGIGGFHAVAFTVEATYDASGRPTGLAEEDPTSSADPVTPSKRSLLSYAATTEEFLAAWRWDDWNAFRIRCQGVYPVLTVWINDMKIAELDAAALEYDGYDRDAVAGLLGRAGHIALEVHDNDQWFGDDRWGPGAVTRWRNIWLREL